MPVWIHRTCLSREDRASMRTIACCLVVGLLGCSSEKPAGPQADQGLDKKNAAQNDSLPVLMRGPEFVLTDQSGESQGSDQLLGRAWVVNFMFTRCKATCPVQTRRLAELQEELRNRPSWKDIRLVSISVDPDYDTPEVLHDYADKAGADRQHWKFLTGPRETIDQLARQGFKLPADVGGSSQSESIAHSSKFALVDPQGDVRGYYDSGSSAELARLKRDLETTLAERVLIVDDLVDPPWMDSRRRAQLATVERFSVFHEFSFSDRLRESGIRFRNRSWTMPAANTNRVITTTERALQSPTSMATACMTSISSIRWVTTNCGETAVTERLRTSPKPPESQSTAGFT